MMYKLHDFTLVKQRDFIESVPLGYSTHTKFCSESANATEKQQCAVLAVHTDYFILSSSRPVCNKTF